MNLRKKFKNDIILQLIILFVFSFTLFAKEVNEFLKYPHHILEIDPESFPAISSKINKTIKTENLSWNENCIAFHYVSKLANNLNLDTVITANGIDELFCGYNAYREAFSGGESQINQVMDTKLDNELKMMKAVNLIASEFGVKILQPLLSEKFIKYAKTVPTTAINGAILVLSNRLFIEKISTKAEPITLTS